MAASAAETELGSLFLNEQETVNLRIALQELGHTQPPTPIHAGNTTAMTFHSVCIAPLRNIGLPYFI